MGILLASIESFLPASVFVATVGIPNKSFYRGEYGHKIKEGITFIALKRSILALLQSVCFYSNVLLKSAQSPPKRKKEMSRIKKYHSFKPLG